MSHAVSQAYSVDNGPWASGEPTREETVRWASGPPGARPVPDQVPGLQRSASQANSVGGGVADPSIGNNPAHNRREGSSTFLPGMGARSTTGAGEYNNPASPTGRGGRKFRPPPAPHSPPYSPPQTLERLPPTSTYYGSTSGLVAPRMAVPELTAAQARAWPPPPLLPDEVVDAGTAVHAREAQAMRKLCDSMVT